MVTEPACLGGPQTCVSLCLGRCVVTENLDERTGLLELCTKGMWIVSLPWIMIAPLWRECSVASECLRAQRFLFRGKKCVTFL